MGEKVTISINFVMISFFLKLLVEYETEDVQQCFNFVGSLFLAKKIRTKKSTVSQFDSAVRFSEVNN